MGKFKRFWNWQDWNILFFYTVYFNADTRGNVFHLQKKALKQQFHFKADAYHQYKLIGIPMFIKIDLAFL